MFDPIFDEILKRLLQAREANGLPIEGPITTIDIISLEPINAAIQWVADSCELRNQPTPISVELPKAVGASMVDVAAISLFYGMPIKQLADAIKLMVDCAFHVATDSIESNLLFQSKDALQKLSALTDYIKVNYPSDAADTAIASMSVVAAAHAFALMFKAVSIGHGRTAYFSWQEKQIIPTDLDSFIDASDFKYEGPGTSVNDHFEPEFWEKLAKIGLRFGFAFPKQNWLRGHFQNILMDEFQPRSVALNQWRVGDEYYASHDGALLAAFSLAMKSVPLPIFLKMEYPQYVL